MARGHEDLLLDLFPVQDLDPERLVLDAAPGAGGGNDEPFGHEHLRGQLNLEHRLLTSGEAHLKGRAAEAEAGDAEGVVSHGESEAGSALGVGGGPEARGFGADLGAFHRGALTGDLQQQNSTRNGWSWARGSDHGSEGAVPYRKGAGSSLQRRGRQAKEEHRRGQESLEGGRSAGTDLGSHYHGE